MDRRLWMVALGLPAAAGAAWIWQSRPGVSSAQAAGGRLIPATNPRLKEPQRPIRVLAVGDLMLGTNLREQIVREGPRAPFRPWGELLRGADLTLGNLETPLSEGGAPTPGKSAESLKARTNFIFRAPPVAAEGLAWAGFDAVSLANNHAMDYGADALLDTLVHCRSAKVATVGGGANLAEARKPVFLKRGGQTLAIFGISDILPLYSTAGKKTAGVAPARGTGFEKVMRTAIQTAKERADRVLVMVHWGVEKNTGATAKQQRLGRKLVDWGADAVIGSHTHVLGPSERYRDGVIHYSLGNFVTRQGSRRDVPVWELTFAPGKPPSERTVMYRWNGKPVETR